MSVELLRGADGKSFFQVKKRCGSFHGKGEEKECRGMVTYRMGRNDSEFRCECKACGVASSLSEDTMVQTHFERTK